ncbi:PKD domain-containing protein, partial [Haloferax profundi]|uniref:PKD domain-containing protein n=1 Tax=Haloferax profundi TaxID=1544718 RepID=UPI0018D1F87E
MIAASDYSQSGGDLEFASSPHHPVTNRTVMFQSNVVGKIDGTIARSEWEFGDGATASGGLVGHTYTTSGEYTVTHRVVTDTGRLYTTTSNISVSPLENATYGIVSVTPHLRGEPT